MSSRPQCQVTCVWVTCRQLGSARRGQNRIVFDLDDSPAVSQLYSRLKGTYFRMAWIRRSYLSPQSTMAIGKRSNGIKGACGAVAAASNRPRNDSPVRTAILNHLRRYTGCSHAIPRRWRERSKSWSVAASHSLTNWRTNIPRSAPTPRSARKETLEHLTWEGAAWRYPEGLPDDVVQTLRHGSSTSSRSFARYAPYFLTVHSIVRFARSADILCTRAAEAPRIALSATSWAGYQPRSIQHRNDLLFERFVSEERHTSRRTSTSISWNMTAAAKSSCSGSSTSTAGITPPSARP